MIERLKKQFNRLSSPFVYGAITDYEIREGQHVRINLELDNGKIINCDRNWKVKDNCDVEFLAIKDAHDDRPKHKIVGLVSPVKDKKGAQHLIFGFAVR